MIEIFFVRRPWKGKQNHESPSINIGRGPLVTNVNPASGKLLVYVQEMLATQTLDRWCHWIAYLLYFMFFHLYFNDFSFLFPFTSASTPENLPGTSRTHTSVKSKKMPNSSRKFPASSAFPKKEKTFNSRRQLSP